MKLKFFCTFFSLLILVSCGSDNRCELTFFAMDTVISLSVDCGSEAALSECRNVISELEGRLSKTVETSEISAVNNSPDGSAVSRETAELVGYLLEIAEITEGRFTPTLGQITKLWDYKSENISDNSTVENALRLCDFNDLSVKENKIIKAESQLLIDLGGAAKGYICEMAVDSLINSGAEYGVVSIGGNIGVFGENPKGGRWNIGIKDPSEPSELIGKLSIDGGFVAVSGDYERYFEKDGVRYHHIIDPKTGYPSYSGVRSAAVWSYDGTLADALSTALFVGGADYAVTLYNSGIFEFEAIIVTDSGVVTTEGISDYFTLYK